jgi:hypothetical protein
VFGVHALIQRCREPLGGTSCAWNRSANAHRGYAHRNHAACARRSKSSPRAFGLHRGCAGVSLVEATRRFFRRTLLSVSVDGTA